MVSIGWRVGLLALLALAAVGLAQLAPVLRPAGTVDGARTLAWSDLVPAGADVAGVPTANNLVADSLADVGTPQVSTHRLMDGAGVVSASTPAHPTDGSLNGERVALAGYMTPFSFEDERVSAFLLVPYVGACIHVPPPPPNQIVLVESDEPVPVLAMWEPFTAVGTLGVEPRSTDLAEVGYTMRLERIEPFDDVPLATSIGEPGDAAATRG